MRLTETQWAELIAREMRWKSMAAASDRPQAHANRGKVGPPVAGTANAADAPFRVSLALPWPPSANANVRHGRNGHYLSKDHKAFRAEVWLRVVAAGLHRYPLEGRLRAVLLATPPDRRTRDLDNLPKPIFDALQHAGVYANDAAIRDFRVVEHEDGISGEVIVLVEKMLDKLPGLT